MSNGTELNSLTTKANYMVGNISQMGHAPTGCGTSGFFYVDKNSSYVLQRFFGDLDSTHRFSYDGGSTWTSWLGHIAEVQTSNIAAGAESTIAYPTGYTKANTRAVYAFLYIGYNSPRYPSAAEVLYLWDDGIHVKNTGGANGTVVVGIMMK